MATVAPGGESMERSSPLPNQPGLCNVGEGCGIFRHKGTKAWPANPGMLDANEVAGIYDCPGCPKACTLYMRPVPAFGFLCMCTRCGGVPLCCYIAPFNCLGGLGTGGPPLDVWCIPSSKCLPSFCTLAATWFCIPGPCCCCYDFHDVNTMLSTSCCCCCPRVHMKLEDMKQINIPGQIAPR